MGLRLRRARKEAGLSQKALAEKAGVSQPLVSYYERSAGTPDGPGLAEIARVLGVDMEAAGLEPASRPGLVEVDRSWLVGYRAALLASLGRSGLDVGVLDEPAGAPGGDLAYALDLESHVLIVVLDGTGGGDQACVTALIEGAGILGAQALRRGVIWPEELLGAMRGLAGRFGVKTLAAAFVGLIDVRHRELTWALRDFPAPWIRSDGRVRPLSGKPVGDLEAGRVALGQRWLLLVATDGLAHAATRREKTLWETRDLRQLVSNARTPSELLNVLSRRLTGPATGAKDDRLGVAVAESARR